jgi:serine protease Do
VITRLTLLFALAMTCLPAARLHGEAEPEAVPSEPAIDRALAAVYPALVNLSVVRERFVEGRAVRSLVAGSGVIMTPEGHLLTNHHVAAGAVRVRATLSSGEQVEAVVVAHDPPSDLSVLRLCDPGKRRFSPAVFGDSEALAVGEPVLALGNPFVLASSVTRGIVSNPRRVFTDRAGSEILDPEGAGGATGVLAPWIQHDALILPGSSGGPLVDLAGRVVGINELGGEGFGFAIPAHVAAEVLAQVLAHGEVRRAWTGLTLLPAERRGRADGALVAAVAPESPAAAAGLRAGDLLLRIGETPTGARFFEEVPPIYRALAALPRGEPVAVLWEREGKEYRAELVPMPLETAQGREGELRKLGVTVQEITGPMMRKRRLATRDGLLVTGVRPASPAARARPRIEIGDQLVAAAGHPVSGIASLRQRLGQVTSDSLLVELRRGGESILSAVSFAERAENVWGGELPRAWLGVRTQVLGPEIGATLGVAEGGGFRVTEVLPATAAARAGLEPGDLLLALDGQPFRSRRPEEAGDLRQEIAAREVGSRIRLDVRRGGVMREVEVELEAEPRDPADLPRRREERLELVVRDLTRFDRLRLRLGPEATGALVVEVASGGWADLAGVRGDDLIVAFDRQPVIDAEALLRAAAAPCEVAACTRELLVERSGQTQILFVETIPEGGVPCGD